MTGVVVAFAAAGMISEAMGGGAGGLALVFLLLLPCTLGGLIAGALLGYHGRLLMVIIAAAAIVIASIAGVAITGSRANAQYQRRLMAKAEPDGCYNETMGVAFEGSLGFVSFARRCPQEPRITMNLSLLPEAAMKSSDLLPKGPGNVLVIELPDGYRSTVFPARPAGIDVGGFRSGRVVIRYDHRARIVSQNAQVAGVNFTFVPDSLP